MAWYSYTGIDAEGRPVSGELEAAGIDQAIADLAAHGIRVRAESLQAVATSSGGRLSVEEVAELGTQMTELAKAGLPLGPGLRALAEELPRHRLKRTLCRIANELDRGATLDAAIAAEQARLPEHLRAMILAATRSGHLAEVLQELVLIDRKRGEVRRGVVLSLAYPGLLFGMMLAIFAFFGILVVPQFSQIYKDFGTVLPPATKLLLWICSPVSGMASLVLLATLFSLGVVLTVLKPNTAWAQTILYAVPVVGPLWRYHGLAEFSRMMGLLVDLRFPLPQALRITAEGLRAARLARACRRAAVGIEKGTPLSDALSWFSALPQRLQILVDQGERMAALPESFRAATEMFEGQVNAQRAFFDAIILPITLLLIVTFAGIFVTGMLTPLISLMARFSGGW